MYIKGADRMNAIEIRNLTKNFGAKQALGGLDMTVPVGAIYGFIGENGSGKSTTEKIICGLIHKSGGTVKLFGKEHTDHDIRAKNWRANRSTGLFSEYERVEQYAAASGEFKYSECRSRGCKGTENRANGRRGFQ